MAAVAIAPETRLMTAEELDDWGQRPENRNRTYELVRGEPVLMSQPRRNHGFVCNTIGSLFDHYSREAKFGYSTSVTGVLIERDPDTVRGPDVCFWNDIQKPGDFPEKWGDTVPLVAVEVLSPNDKKRMIAEKLEDYLANGVAEVWVVELEEQFVAVHHPDQPPKIYGDKDVLISKVLPGFTCAVSELFHLPNGQPLPKDE